MDKFPEAFRRFEEVVDVDRIQSFRHLRSAFASWAGQKWHGTNTQMNALAVEARRIGIPLIIERKREWRHEIVLVKGVSQERFRDLKTGRFIKRR